MAEGSDRGSRSAERTTCGTEAAQGSSAIGGDSDIIVCMAGGIAHAFYGAIPPHITEEVWRILDDRLKETVQRFMERFGVVV